jgi:hypothetical protein
VQREIDISGDRPAVVRGRITFPQAATAEQQLQVLSRPWNENQPKFLGELSPEMFGARSFVARDGTFSLRVAPGRHQLIVYDFALQVVLFHGDVFDVKTGGEVEHDLAVPLVKLAVELEKAADAPKAALADRLEIRVGPAVAKAAGVQMELDPGYDTGLGLRWPQGQTSLALALPPGEVLLQLRSAVYALHRGDQHQGNAVGRAQFDLTAGPPPAPVKIAVGAPSEINDPPIEEAAGEEKKQ